MVNTIPLIIASYEHALSSVMGVIPDPMEAKGWIGQTLYATFSERYPELAQELVDTYVSWNRAHLDRLLETYDGVDGLLAELRATGIALGVATSKRRSSAEATLASAGLAGLIEITVAMEDTDRHKPDPRPLWLALERMGQEPTTSVYIGDAVVDVLAAKAAGMDVIAVTWGAGEREDLIAAGPTAVVDTVEQLQGLVLGR